MPFKDKEKIREYQREYRRKNKNRLNKQIRKKYRENREPNRTRGCVHAYKKYDEEHKYNICDFDVKWFRDNISSKPCIYCGYTKKIGCDRIDNSKGHTKDNVVPCCHECNTARSDHFTVSEMLRLGKVIREIKNDRLRKDNKS